VLVLPSFYLVEFLFPKKENTTLLGRIEVVLLWVKPVRGLTFCPAKDFKGFLGLLCVVVL
jgi:hypothetical protein